ncbi:MAG: hypothetical protein ACE5NC_09645 [Anaerolineae bacterium]
MTQLTLKTPGESTHGSISAAGLVATALTVSAVGTAEGSIPQVHKPCVTPFEAEMIGRMWHGWTTSENADVYENLLKSEIFPGIASKNVQGYRGIQLFRRPVGEEIEFVTIMWFESWEAVKRFAGENYEYAYVPPRARAVLARFDERSQHYEIREQLAY